MSAPARITVHVLPPSHPCKTVLAALRLKGLDFEEINLPMDETRAAAMEEIYGAGRTTVPGAVVDGEPVHGSRAILERLEQLAPEPALYPGDRADAVREAERWGDEELQDLGRRLPWGALHFRPEALGTLGGGGPLDPAGTDFAIRFARAAWKYHGISCERLAEDLAGLPAKLDHVDGLIADGVVGGEAPNAADLQIAATIRVLDIVGDLGPLLAGRPARDLAHRLFGEYPGEIPAGAFPAAWLLRA